jgi:hypothetical protein
MGRACTEARTVYECSALNKDRGGRCEQLLGNVGNLCERWSDGEGGMA